MERVLSFVICCVYGTKTKTRAHKPSNSHRLLSFLRKKITLGLGGSTSKFMCFEAFLSDENSPKYVLKKYGEESQDAEDYIREPSFFDWLQSSHAVPALPTASELKLLIGWMEEGGFASEALCLRTPVMLEEAARLISEHAVITIACPSYPPQFCLLGSRAPAVLFVSHPALVFMPPWFDNKGNPRTVVSAAGSRQPLTVAHSLAKCVGSWVASVGALGVSGGAEGCDAAFGEGVTGAGGEIVHLLPHGIGTRKLNPLHSYLSVCPFDEPFSAARAMERNSLIYAFGDFTLICCSRYRVGGTWIGATQALQMHLPVAIVNWSWILEDQNKGGRASAAGGAGASGKGPGTTIVSTSGGGQTPADEETVSQFWSQVSSNYAIGQPGEPFGVPAESAIYSSFGPGSFGELTSISDFELDEIKVMNSLSNGVYMQAQKALEALGAYSLRLDPRNIYESVQQEMPAALDWARRRRSGELNFGLFAS
jgi:hypothetical protein